MIRMSFPNMTTVGGNVEATKGEIKKVVLDDILKPEFADTLSKTYIDASIEQIMTNKSICR